jgi:hypothetical protein
MDLRFGIQISNQSTTLTQIIERKFASLELLFQLLDQLTKFGTHKWSNY